MRSLVMLTCCLLAACTSSKFLGSEQEALSARACAIEKDTCGMVASSQSTQGRKTQVNGSYKFDSLGGGTYTLSGKVRLRYDDPIVKNIKNLDLTFIFFKGDFVVHEEKIRVRGSMDKYLEFSTLIKSDVEIESSHWAWYSWRANELQAF